MKTQGKRKEKTRCLWSDVVINSIDDVSKDKW